MLNSLYSLIWGNGTLALTALCGVILLIRCRFVQIRKLAPALMLPFEKRKKFGGLSPFAALATALAGTMGVGNIIGVGTAIVIGGAGAVFWMWVAAFIGMGIKYAEIFLAVKFKDQNSYGAMGYIKNGLKFPRLAIFFALVTVAASFGIGNSIQIGAVKECFTGMGFPMPWLMTVAILIPFAVIILKGDSAVSGSAERIIPIISVIYIAGCVGIICMNISSLPTVFETIFSQALNVGSVAGAAAGGTVKHCIRVGVAQGVFSNEAGMGSSSIVLSMTDEQNGAKQGLWGIFEVFFDTIVICTLTALSVLCSGIDLSLSAPAGATYDAFISCYRSFGGLFITVSVTVFAMATLICWSYYGTQAIRHITNKKKSVFAYKIIFVSVAAVSVFFEFNTLHMVCDILNGIMLLINLPVIILLSNHVKTDEDSGNAPDDKETVL